MLKVKRSKIALISKLYMVEPIECGIRLRGKNHCSMDGNYTKI